MMVIDAMLTDGRPALVDLEGASPTGGQVTSASRPARELLTGDVIRHHGAWMVCAAIGHNGFTGVTTAVLVDQDMTQHRLTETGGSVCARTDTRIDPDSLWRLTTALVAS